MDIDNNNEASANCIDDDDDDDDDPDNDSIEARTASSTTAETLSARTRSRITDFALVFWLEDDTNIHPEREGEGDGFLIRHEFIAALIEIKRSPSRKLTGQKLVGSQGVYLVHAKRDVFRQALYLFANPRWSRQKSVLVIAATGDLWSYTVIFRTDHVARTAGANELDPEWEPVTSRFTVFPWSPPTIWGSAGEDARRIEDVTKWIIEYYRKLKAEVRLDISD